MISTSCTHWSLAALPAVSPQYWSDLLRGVWLRLLPCVKWASMYIVISFSGNKSLVVLNWASTCCVMLASYTMHPFHRFNAAALFAVRARARACACLVRLPPVSVCRAMNTFSNASVDSIGNTTSIMGSGVSRQPQSGLSLRLAKDKVCVCCGWLVWDWSTTNAFARHCRSCNGDNMHANVVCLTWYYFFGFLHCKYSPWR